VEIARFPRYTSYRFTLSDLYDKLGVTKQEFIGALKDIHKGKIVKVTKEDTSSAGRGGTRSSYTTFYVNIMRKENESLTEDALDDAGVSTSTIETLATRQPNQKFNVDGYIIRGEDLLDYFEPLEKVKVGYVAGQIPVIFDRFIEKQEGQNTIKESLSPEEAGASGLFNDLIQREYEQLNQYDSVQITLEDQGDDRFSEILEYIKDDLNIHIGMLQSCLDDITGSGEQVDQGEAQAD